MKNILPKGDTINGILKAIITLSILFLIIGTVSAHENVSDTLNQNDSSFKEIEDSINSCEDNGCVKLDEKTYSMDCETHIILNKSVTIEGLNSTVIDGNGNCLYLDILNESEDDEPVIHFVINGYTPKNTGKNITFQNITFKDLTITTWHEMKFLNCNFINTTFTSYEMDNDFRNCHFDKSKVEIVLFFGEECPNYSKFAGCEFDESEITYKAVRTPNYFQIVGGDRFYTVNSIDLIDSRFKKTNITLYRFNVRVDNSSFSDLRLDGSSNILNVTGSSFENPSIGLHMSEIAISESDIENSTFSFSAGYFGNGCKIFMKNTILNRSNIRLSVNYASRTSSLEIENSCLNSVSIDSTDTFIAISDSNVSDSKIELFFSSLSLENTTFFSDGGINDTLITKTTTEIYHYHEDGEPTVETVECLQKTNYTSKDSYLVNDTGKYEIINDDININTLYNLTFINSSVYYFNDELVFELKDQMGKPVANVELFVYDLNDYMYPIPSIKTDSNGTAKYRLNKHGNLNLNVYYESQGYEFRKFEHGIKINLTVKPTISGIKVKKELNSNVYLKTDGTIKIKAISNVNGNLSNIKIACKIFTKKKSRTYYSTTNSKGMSTFKIPKNLNAGSHKVEISVSNTKIKKTLTVKIAKAKASVKAPKVTGKFKKSRYFKVTVKANRKAVKNVKVKIKVYTGNKYKTYTVKTDKKGIAKINIKKLKTGKHGVVVSSGDNNYKISAKSQIKII